MGKHKHNFRLLGRRALSPIFATMLLAAIIILFGSIAYYFSSNLTTTATNNYIQTSSNSQQAISERLGFENVAYTNPTLTIYIINFGSANSVQINAIFIYDSNNNLVAPPYQGSQISALNYIGGGAIPGNHLNAGKEGYFTVSPVTVLKHGSIYTIQLVTKSGSSFDYDFTA